MKEKN